MQEIEVFVAVDSEGTYVVNTEASELDFSDLIGASRVIRVLLNVPLPKVTTVSATLAEERQCASVVSAAVTQSVVAGDGEDDDVVLPS